MGRNGAAAMKRLALLFPGQGSQYIGMGKEFYNAFPVARDIIDEANDVLGFDLKKIIFDGPEDTLRQTQYTQPAIFTVSLAIFEVFANNYPLVYQPGGKPTREIMCAGHSLGEYSALGATEVFRLKHGLNLVKARGEFIQKASRQNPGTMAAVIGLDKNKINEICLKISNEGKTCEAVNFNSPEQTVIAGTQEGINEALKLCAEAGASKTVPLNVSGPFHSKLMDPAAEMMNSEIAGYSFSTPKFTFISNCDAKITLEPREIKANLVNQINHPVLWEDSIKVMIQAGAEVFLEIGPGRVLSGLMRRIDKTRKILNIEDIKSLEKAVQELKQ